MSDFKWTNVTGDMKIVDLLKKREEIEKQIRELDEMALVRYEFEKLALPQANDVDTGEKQCNLSVVIESAFIEVFDKAACIKHWHNTGKNDEGMVVSSEKVYELWEALEKYRDYRHSL